MKKKRILSLGLIVIGGIALFLSHSIKVQVEGGRETIEKAQKSVDRGNSLFSLNPVTQQVGQGFTGSIQKKIDEGKREASYYEGIASLLLVGGIILIVGGAGFFYYARRN